MQELQRKRSIQKKKPFYSHSSLCTLQSVHWFSNNVLILERHLQVYKHNRFITVNLWRIQTVKLKKKERGCSSSKSPPVFTFDRRRGFPWNAQLRMSEFEFFPSPSPSSSSSSELEVLQSDEGKEKSPRCGWVTRRGILPHIKHKNQLNKNKRSPKKIKINR